MSTPTAIRLSMTTEVLASLRIAKRRYPALSDPEILKLGLSKIVAERSADLDELERESIRAGAARSFGEEYLTDTAEDIYTDQSGKPVHFA
jgi:hypothetical protein